MGKKVIKLIVVIACVLTVMFAFIHRPQAAVTLLRLGSKGEEVVRLQNRLHDLGYFDYHGATGNFATLTRTAVTRFQSVNGTAADGIAGPITLNKLYSNSAKSLVLRAGNSGQAVQSMQLRLKTLGYFSGVGTGVFGAVTLKSVKQFQREHGLVVDGIAGPLTRKMLFSNKAKTAALASPVKNAAFSVADIAAAQTNKPYALGAAGPDSYDCSGLAFYAMTQAGYSVTRLSSAGYSAVSTWSKISGKDNLAKGDLLFFRSDESPAIGHMGIYLGNGQFVHASSGQAKVMLSTIDNVYWTRNLAFARRIF